MSLRVILFIKSSYSGHFKSIGKYGRDEILCYHIKYRPLEESILDKFNDDGTTYKTDVYAKAIVQKSTDKVLGLHYAGPHAG